MFEKRIAIEHCVRTIRTTENFMKAARRIGSPECQMVMELRKAFPDYSLEVKATRKSAPTSYGGLTYSFMESYIQMQDNSNKLLEEFASLRALGMNYAQIKKWFLSRFPEFTCTAA